MFQKDVVAQGHTVGDHGHVDGFAGGGRYSFRGEELPGSPIILLRTIAEAEQKLNAARPKGFEIKTNFVFIRTRDFVGNDTKFNN